MKLRLIVLSLIILFQITPRVTLADDPAWDWVCTYDFTASQSIATFSFGESYGHWEDGVGLVMPYFPGFNQVDGVVYYDWGMAVPLVMRQIDYYTSSGGGIHSGPLGLDPTFDVGEGTWVDYTGATAIQAFEHEYLKVEAAPTDTIIIEELRIYGTGESPLEECSAPPGGDYIRPYRADDELQIFDGIGLHLPSLLNADLTPQAAGQVYALSNVAGAPVMAAEGGTVTLEQITPADCSGGLAAILTNLNGGYGRCVFMLNDNASADLLNLYVMDDVVSTWKVTLTGDDGNNFVYILANADHYISNDMHVNAGCVIGESNPFNPASPSWLQTAWDVLDTFFAVTHLYFNISNVDYPGAGITLIRFDDTSMVSNPPWPLVDPVLSQLTVYNDEAQPCNLTPGLQDCLNTNPEFRREGEGWTPVGGMTFGAAGGVILEKGASLQQQLNLDPETEYTLVVHAAWAIDSDLANRVDRTLHLRLGEDVEDFTVPSDGTVGEYAIPMGIHAADLGDTFWTVLVQNTSLYDLYIQDACVTSSTTHTAPQACYFANSEFNDYSSQWENSSPSPVVLFFAGFAQLPDSGWISQSVSLEPGTYTLVVKAHIYGSYDGEGEASAELSYTWPADTASPVSAGSVDTGYILPGHPGYPSDFQTLTTEIVVTEATEGDFHISAAVTGTGVDGIAIDSACLQGAGNGTSGPPTPECSTAARPQGSDIGLWFTWHWHNLNQFFQCDLMVLLNKMYRLGQETYKTVGYSAKWNMAYLRLAWRWSDTQLFPWLNGHFRNIAIGQVTTITNEEGGCHDIFCAVLGVIDTLANSLTPIIGALANAINALVGILIGGANLFFSVIAGVIAFVLAVVVKLLLFLQSILSLLATIITAYNTATPATIEGLPTCSIDPNSSLLCISTWTMDNTIFSGRWGVLFTIILSLLGIHLALWAIGEFKRMILNMSSTT